EGARYAPPQAQGCVPATVAAPPSAPVVCPLQCRDSVSGSRGPRAAHPPPTGGTPVFGDDMPRSSIGRFLMALPLALLILSIASQAFAAWPNTPSGVPVSTAPPRSDGAPLAVQDSCGGAIIAWLDTIPGSSSIDVQRMDYAGQARWVPNGFPVTPFQSGPIAFDIAADTTGGAFVAFTDHRISGDTTDVYLVHVLSNG